MIPPKNVFGNNSRSPRPQGTRELEGDWNMSIMQTYTKQYEMQLFLFGQQILAQVAQDHNLDHTAMVKKYLSTPGFSCGYY